MKKTIMAGIIAVSYTHLEGAVFEVYSGYADYQIAEVDADQKSDYRRQDVVYELSLIHI